LRSPGDYRQPTAHGNGDSRITPWVAVLFVGSRYSSP
jgi:hypothetical protein